MLTDEEKATIAAQEKYRKEVRDELNPRAFSWASFFSLETGKWVLTALAIPFSVWLWNGAEKERQDSRLVAEAKIAASRKDVDQVTGLLPGLSSSDPKLRAISLLLLGHLDTLQDGSPSTHALYQGVRTQALQDRATGDAAEKTAGAKTSEALLKGAAGDSLAPPTVAPGDAKTAQAVPVGKAPPLSSVGPTNFVYTQIYHEDQRPLAARLAERLRAEGVPVIGIQNVLKGRGADELTYAQKGAIDIRYYHQEDRAAALSLAPVIKASSPELGEPTVHDLSKRKRLGKLGLIEIWYPCVANGAVCQPQP